jgi:hypothetical protein
MQQGRYAGRLIHARVSGQTAPRPFSYFDKVNMEVVGKGFAVLESGRLRISGFLAWLAWAVVHLQFLGQSSLRISVFLQWVWTILTGHMSSRLIVNHHASAQQRRAAVRRLRNANPRARGSRLAALPCRTRCPNGRSSHKPLAPQQKELLARSMEFGIVVAPRWTRRTLDILR